MKAVVLESAGTRPVLRNTALPDPRPGQVAPLADEELPLSADSVMRACERVTSRDVVGRIVIGG